MMKLSVEKPEKRCGVYAWVNETNKIAYIGESSDLNRRICEHILSIFGYENSSNANLVNAASNNAFKGMMLYYTKIYEKSNDTEIKQWLIDETIYMYVFVINGYRLLNGKEDFYKTEELEYPNRLTDNIGSDRSFLRDYTDEKQLSDQLYEYCKSNGITDEEEIEKEINTACQNVEKAFRRFEEKNKHGKIYHINGNNIFKNCNEIRNAYLRREDLDSIGIRAISINDLKNNCDKIAVCGFGDYLDQSAYTILITKLYDIMHNTMIVDSEGKNIIFRERKAEDESGVCFWACGKKDTSHYRQYLSDGEIDRTPKYLLLPYTNSKLYAKSNCGNADEKKNRECLNYRDEITVEEFFGNMRKYYDEKKTEVEQMLRQFDERLLKERDYVATWQISSEKMNYRLRNDFFVLGLAWDRKSAEKGRNLIDYPVNMFPEVVQKISVTRRETLRNKSNVAFLISELHYVNAPVDAPKLFQYFTSNTGNKLCDTLNGINNVSVAELTDREGMNNYLDSIKEDNVDEIKMLVAKIEYPYIVALV